LIVGALRIERVDFVPIVVTHCYPVLFCWGLLRLILDILFVLIGCVDYQTVRRSVCFEPSSQGLIGASL
jgi:hypothetical protein